ncbi:hypothetical protein TBLA_0I01550 [Henningerozyma blattae CBS 6284]|uniref:Uncharacterized protein n=1 Tax=Henningerozyma blattae (strain ATCC 34711 / CBS 6284 / DSM 70876 / NBRC 10599 / NRRL Y-10934 / UCD 77-7) TaxID=1071380 RepID=I2H8W2_HENB6|nr:hypothetical protein TBLA_0I01550 [Tetrapisispora blattae CBS 6284]CCH62814.1 hypothetical protein TBLA_0I01550 [Tetrapisispora blattae CBS 6284]
MNINDLTNNNNNNNSSTSISTHHQNLSQEEVNAVQVLDHLRATTSNCDSTSVSPTLTPITSNTNTFTNRYANQTISSSNTLKRREDDAISINSKDPIIDYSKKPKIYNPTSFSTTNTSTSKIPVNENFTECLERHKDNLKEYKLNMSIESKKKLVSCVQVLKLANNHLTKKVKSLQHIIDANSRASPSASNTSTCSPRKEPNTIATTRTATTTTTITTTTTKKEDDVANTGYIDSDLDSDPEADSDDDEYEEQSFYDAEMDPQARSACEVLNSEIVGTIKKVCHLISTGGTSLPEPARSEVRQCLLRLPSSCDNTKRRRSSDLVRDTSKRVLLLAKDSLDMVNDVTQLVDSTLDRAEEFIKSKQEKKELLKQEFLRSLHEKEMKRRKSILQTTSTTESTTTNTSSSTTFGNDELTPVTSNMNTSVLKDNRK